MATATHNVVFRFLNKINNNEPSVSFSSVALASFFLRLVDTDRSTGMPSASAKIEKIIPMETIDPVKQFVQMLEKRMRNLEKRKIKLDNYRSDVENGKELNEDQKMAVSKYDSVIQLLEFTKDLTKSANTIVVDSVRQQKKLAKKEQIERQQHEIQRLQEAFLYCHLLSCFQNEDVRSDFLNGENGAVQLTSEQLSQLDQLHKLIGPGLPNEQSDIENHFHVLAENHIFLVEGKNKEIVGTTYKVLKELLLKIKECGYFSRSTESVDDCVSSDDTPEECVVPQVVGEDLSSNVNDVEPVHVEPYEPEVIHSEPVQEAAAEIPPIVQNGPLQEVLSTQGNFNFLQESQIDLDAPHMDPAVVAVHQIAPPPAVNFAGYSTPPVDEVSTTLVNGSNCHEPPTSPSVNQGLVISPSVAPVLAPHDFDPSHPIPTQTFTNQSFAVMQNMIVPPTYVPVTMHHGPIPPHITPIAVVPGPAVTSASVLPIPVPVPQMQVPVQDGASVMGTKTDIEDANNESVTVSDAVSNPSEAFVEKGNENIGYNGNRGGYRDRGRGRGRGNGYFRGRGNFHNGRNGYQNNYYPDRNGYNPNYRRGNNRGGPRGNGVNNRGRGNYRTQNSQQQQQPPPQQTQQQ